MAGEYADYPVSFGGKIVFLVLLIFEMGVFAMLTGTFSAIMYDKLKESAMHKPANPDDLNKHIIICGFSAKAAILASEFLMDPAFKHSEIPLVSEKPVLKNCRSAMSKLIVSAFSKKISPVWKPLKSRVERAVAAVILSEDGENRTTQDIDARTILAALTIEKLNLGAPPQLKSTTRNTPRI